jgi:hypothetical protein
MTLIAIFGMMCLDLLSSSYSNPAHAARPQIELGIQSSYQLSKDLLTTDLAWELDPLHLNPHLQRWALSRNTKLIGLHTVLRPKDQFGVDADGISTVVKGYVRQPGNWYRSLAEFDCSQEPNSWFATQNGSQIAAAQAADIWSNLLKQKKIKLSLLFERVKEESEDLALERAQEIFKNWLQETEAEWRLTVQQKARKEEWKTYLAEAKQEKICPRKGSKNLVTPSWSSMMEAVRTEPVSMDRILARAPARLWNGLFSVRLNVRVGEKVLNGRFLIDSGAGQSLISPSWLEGQGIDPAWVVIPGSYPRRVSWGDLWQSEGGLARVAFLDGIDLGGLKVPLNEFLLYETDFFGPPESVGTCCDGVLGSDFLRLYPVEFRPNTPTEVIVWPREKFSWNPDSSWVEVTQGVQGDLVSGCSASPDVESKNSSLNKQLEKIILPGVRWDSGGDVALHIHTPWQKKAAPAVHQRWSIQCESLQVATGVPAYFPKPPGGSSDRGLHSTQIPAVTAGIPVLAQTGKSFTFDLPHGRVWFSGGTRELQGMNRNLSGIKVEFDTFEGDRILVVQSIQPRTPGQDLVKVGLKPGMIITQIDSKNADELDLWEVERKLSGELGDIVTLQWKTKKGLKMAPLKLR